MAETNFVFDEIENENLKISRKTIFSDFGLIIESSGHVANDLLLGKSHRRSFQ